MFLSRSKCVVLLFLIHNHYVHANIISPKGLSEKSSSSEAATQRKSGSEYVALDAEKSVKEGTTKFDKDQSDAHGKKESSGHFEKQDSNEKGHEVNHENAGSSKISDQGKNAQEQHNAGQYKKGYHRSGFTNNYHKDESGDKSSFYEDTEDENGHRSYGNRDAYYDKNSANDFKNGLRDSSYVGRNGDQRGRYEKDEGYDNRHLHSGEYDTNRYHHDDRRNYLQDEAGRYYDGNRNRHYYEREQPYYDNYHGYHYYPNYYYYHEEKPKTYAHGHVDALPKAYYDMEVSNVFRHLPNLHDQELRSRGEVYYPNYRGNGRNDYYGTSYKSRNENSYYPDYGYYRL